LIGVVKPKSTLEERIKKMLNRRIPVSTNLVLAGLFVIILSVAIWLLIPRSEPKIGKGPEREMKVTLGWNGERVKIPAPVVFPNWVRETREFERWKQTGGVRTFTTYDIDGYEYAALVHSVIDQAEGSRYANVVSVLRYTPDGRLEASTSYSSNEVPRTWITYNEDEHRKIQVVNRPNDEDCKMVVSFYGRDGRKTMEWQINEFNVVYAEMITELDERSRFSHYLEELIHSPYTSGVKKKGE